MLRITTFLTDVMSRLYQQTMTFQGRLTLAKLTGNLMAAIGDIEDTINRSESVAARYQGQYQGMGLLVSYLAPLPHHRNIIPRGSKGLCFPRSDSATWLSPSTLPDRSILDRDKMAFTGCEIYISYTKNIYYMDIT